MVTAVGKCFQMLSQGLKALKINDKHFGMGKESDHFFVIFERGSMHNLSLIATSCHLNYYKAPTIVCAYLDLGASHRCLLNSRD